MARSLQQWLDAYGESHQNPTNKLVHWVCVPSIFFSIVGLLYAIPFPEGKSMLMNWAVVALLFVLFFYLRLSFTMFAGFLALGGIMLWAWYSLELLGVPVALTAVAIFVLAWIGQFWGHKIEGKKPSFLEDIQFLLIGPAWLMHFIYRQLGIPY